MAHYELPNLYEKWLEEQLSKLGYSLNDPTNLAKAVQKTSDYFIGTSDKTTPWEKPETKAAYLAYFFPLNFVRTQKAIAEGQRIGFFKNISIAVDFGCGPGTASKALAHMIPEIHRFIGLDRYAPLKDLFQYPDQDKFTFRNQYHKPQKPYLLAMNYVLNELSTLPQWFADAKAIFIVEPSTYKESQKLHKVRQQLITSGYHIWAPCLHQESCPVLGHKKDWCHDRLYWKQPQWMKELEKNLPIKNESLTFSYLLARKDPPPQTEGLRVIGDARKEKGKTKWMVCEPEQRVFISCLHRKGAVPEIYRGDIVDTKSIEKKSQEWRFQATELTKIATYAKTPTLPEHPEKDH